MNAARGKAIISAIPCLRRNADHCSLSENNGNFPVLRRGAPPDSVPAVILQDMPAKTIHRLIRSITWTEVDAVFAPNNVLRRFVLKGMRRTQDLMRRRAPYSLAQGPRIHLILKIQTV